jgi:hypothetical protein
MVMHMVAMHSMHMHMLVGCETDRHQTRKKRQEHHVRRRIVGTMNLHASLPGYMVVRPRIPGRLFAFPHDIQIGATCCIVISQCARALSGINGVNNKSSIM